MDIFFVNGNFVKEDSAEISVNDLSILRGFGVFDFLRTYNGVPFYLEEHILRLKRSASLIGLELPYSPQQLKEIVTETLERNDHPESQIRIVATGGQSDDGITPGQLPSLMVMVNEVKPMPTEWYQHGVKVVSCPIDRFLPGAKSINYIPAIVCQKEASAQQAIEAIYSDRDGFLQEGTTSNIFVVKDKSLITPPVDRILPGVTRQVVINLMSKKYKIIERPIHTDEIRLIDEAFITSSVKEIVPVVTINSIRIGTGSIGKTTQKTLDIFHNYTDNYSGD